GVAGAITNCLCDRLSPGRGRRQRGPCLCQRGTRPGRGSGRNGRRCKRGKAHSKPRPPAEAGYSRVRRLTVSSDPPWARSRRLYATANATSSAPGPLSATQQHRCNDAKVRGCIITAALGASRKTLLVLSLTAFEPKRFPYRP